MKDSRLGGLALIAGAIAGMITMSLHPAGRQHVMSRQEMEMVELALRAVHALAIASLPITFLGALVLTRRLDTPARISVVALAVYGFALVAVMIAASMSGFVAPAIMHDLVAGDPLTETRRLFLDYTHSLNQAFAELFTIGSSVAIILWSTVMVRRQILSRALGIYGMVLGLAIIVACLSGHLQLDVHGFGIVIVSQSIWFIVTGFLLIRAPAVVRLDDPL